jgi:hypothetical protein
METKILILTTSHRSFIRVVDLETVQRFRYRNAANIRCSGLVAPATELYRWAASST